MLQTILADTLPKMSKLGKELWAKIFLMEKNDIIGKFYLNAAEVVIDDSSVEYTGSV